MLQNTKSFLNNLLVTCSALLLLLAISLLNPNQTLAFAACDADILPSGTVDISDYSLLINNFFTSNAVADIDGSGTVDIIDYSILINFFFDTCTAEPSPTPTPVVSPTPTATPISSSQGIWISGQEISQLPTSGSAWDNVVSYANSTSSLPDFEASDSNFQNDNTNVAYLAKAMVGVRNNDQQHINKVEAGIQAIIDSNPNNYNFRALGLGRELGTYVLAADIINLKTINPTLDQAFRDKLVFLRTVPTPGGPSNLIECSDKRPNNWGTHCTSTRIVIALYLNDSADLSQAVKVFKGWLGDRSAYSSFSYGDLIWQCNPSQPVGVNPKDGCQISGHNVGGAQPEERRRSQTTFSWPPAPSGYEWESLQGAYMSATMLSNAGYTDVWQWQDQALLRTVMWNYSGIANYNSMGFPFDPQSEMNFPATGDDSWIPHLVNHYYGTSIPTSVAKPGKNIGFTDWTH